MSRGPSLSASPKSPSSLQPIPPTPSLLVQPQPQRPTPLPISAHAFINAPANTQHTNSNAQSSTPRLIPHAQTPTAAATISPLPTAPLYAASSVPFAYANIGSGGASNAPQFSPVHVAAAPYTLRSPLPTALPAYASSQPPLPSAVAPSSLVACRELLAMAHSHRSNGANAMAMLCAMAAAHCIAPSQPQSASADSPAALHESAQTMRRLCIQTYEDELIQAAATMGRLYEGWKPSLFLLAKDIPFTNESFYLDLCMALTCSRQQQQHMSLPAASSILLPSAAAYSVPTAAHSTHVLPSTSPLASSSLSFVATAASKSEYAAVDQSLSSTIRPLHYAETSMSGPAQVMSYQLESLQHTHTYTHPYPLPSIVPLTFNTQSAIATSASAMPFVSGMSDRGMLTVPGRTIVGSRYTVCKYCFRSWDLATGKDEESQKQRSRALKAKRDHVPYCPNNPKRENNLLKRRLKKLDKQQSASTSSTVRAATSSADTAMSAASTASSKDDDDEDDEEDEGEDA